MGASPLRARVVTGLVLIPLATALVLLLPTPILGVLIGLVVVMGAWEWAALVGVSRYRYVLLTVAGLMVAWLLLQSATSTVDLLVFAVVMWGVGLLVVWRYPQLPPWWRTRPVQAVAGLLVLVPAWAALVALHGGRLLAEGASGPHYTLFLLVLVWVADSAAFFVGRRWGSRRLAPRVSPAKTLEGLWGALLATLVVALVGAWWLGRGQWLVFVVLCVVTLLSSVVGDLMESVLKRTQGAKDSGALLPGHGGVLDRIDSLTAASPVFVLGLVLCGH